MGTVSFGMNMLLSAGGTSFILLENYDGSGDIAGLETSASVEDFCQSSNLDGVFFSCSLNPVSGSFEGTFDIEEGNLSATGTWFLQPNDPLPNFPPVAVRDRYFLAGNQTSIIDAAEGVLANDEDLDGDVLTVRLLSGTKHGVLFLAPDGGFEYRPDSGFSGSDAFRYEVSDGLIASHYGEVELRIKGGISLPWLSVLLE